MGAAPRVAILNTSQDVIDVLRDVCEDAGMDVVTGYIVDFRRGERDLGAFLTEHRPQVIIYDIALPYRENWQYFATVRALSGLPDGAFVLTTTNKTVLEALVGPTGSFELVGKPFDIDQIVAATRHALEAGA